ncbi:MAG: hypothetical protein F6K39_38900 [Okeania sp. SIO3B3]|nr:hypothetical protein [Okeania sp. SIO3B3]
MTSLSLGVERIRGENLRLSYVTWEENWVIPSLTLEVVLKIPGEEYREKVKKYEEYGVLYFVEYAPIQEEKPKLSLYRLNGEGKYELQEENPLWMPEIGLGIGTEVGNYQGITWEWLHWYDEQGNRYLTDTEMLQQLRQKRLEAEFQLQQTKLKRQQAEVEKLAARLRELGIDPDQLQQISDK